MSILALAAAGIASVRDVTPAAVNWANISGATSGTNANQTISDISSTIDIYYERAGDFVTLEYSLNGGAFTALNASTNLTVSDGDTVRWQASTGLGAASSTVTVKNASDGDTTLDTFTVTLTG